MHRVNAGGVDGGNLPAASVAIDPAPFRGVLPLPVSSLKSAFPVLGQQDAPQYHLDIDERKVSAFG